MNTNKIKETINLTLEGKMTFPLVVGTLIGEGVESYHVDYVRSENTYYLPKRFRQEKLTIILFRKK